LLICCFSPIIIIWKIQTIYPVFWAEQHGWESFPLDSLKKFFLLSIFFLLLLYWGYIVLTIYPWIHPPSIILHYSASSHS
jgi:hypothetical protein